jgi:hypothetical protein
VLLLLLLPLRLHPRIARWRCRCSADAVCRTTAGAAMYAVAIYELLQQR